MTQTTTPSTLSEQAKAAFAKFVVIQRSDGLRGALAVLLQQTEFRFIGIWLFKDGKAKAVIHVDREHPETESVPEVGETATYCSLMRRTGEPFATPNAMDDVRLAAHPARTSVLSYSGVPVVDVKGDVIGSLCLYDLQPRDVTQVDESLMTGVSRYLALGGLIPLYK